MTDPAVSVILPVYNSSRFLDEALRSVRTQSFNDFEIVVINDGSTDNSAKIIDRHAAEDKRLVVLHRTNGGVAIALNAGLKICRGRFIARMDGDDVCHPQRLKIQTAFLSSNLDVSIVGSRSYYINADGSVLRPSFERLTTGGICMSLATGCPVLHPSVMMRREHLEAMGGYPEQPSEDYALWVKTVQSGARIAALPNRLIRYRLHGSNTGGTTPYREHSVTLAHGHIRWLVNDQASPEACESFRRLTDQTVPPPSGASDDFIMVGELLLQAAVQRFKGKDRLEACKVIAELSAVATNNFAASGHFGDARRVRRFMLRCALRSTAQASACAKLVVKESLRALRAPLVRHRAST